MQNVVQGSVSDSDKDSSSETSGLVVTTDKWQTYAQLQHNKFSTSSAEDDSEDDDLSEVESFLLGDGEESEALGDDISLGAVGGLLHPGNSASDAGKFLLAAAHYSSASDSNIGLLDGSTAASSQQLQAQFDPDTQAQIVALKSWLQVAGEALLPHMFLTDQDANIHQTLVQSEDPEVLHRLNSTVSSALDEAAAALTRMREDNISGAAAQVAVNGSHSNSSASGCSSTSSSSNSTSNSALSTPLGGGQRTLVEACSDGDVLTVRKLLDEGRSVHETTEEGESLLSLACSAGYYDLAQVLLAMRANVEDRGIKGDCTPLMEAASAGHVDIVMLLLEHNADVNAQSSSGNTPLMYACAGGHPQVVKVLLDNGANVEDHNENGHTPLMEAASAGHVQVAKILLEHGAGINTSSNEFKESALTLACYKGHLDMVKFLLDAGADQEHKTDEMHTALMEASMDGHVEVARLLLDSGAQVNMPVDSFESPLTLAACGGHVELAQLLLERGAKIEEVNDEGYTPLMEAAREGHEEMVALLLAHDADINAQTEETQETALTLACCGGFKDVAALLIKHGADLEIGASTPLMEAAQEGHRELVDYLLKSYANVSAQTSTGDTALTYACENGHTDVAELLLRDGGDLVSYFSILEHESEGGRTPLMKACRAGHLCTVQFLIVKGANVNKTTTDNDHTPLSLACVGGHARVVELLLANHADPHHKLKDNSTMLMEASKGGHTNVVKILIDYPNSISHLLPVVATPNPHSMSNGTAIEGSTLTGPLDDTILDDGSQVVNQHLSMGLVIPAGDPQQPIVLNPTNQLIFNDISAIDSSKMGLSNSVSSTIVTSAIPPAISVATCNARGSKLLRKTSTSSTNTSTCALAGSDNNTSSSSNISDVQIASSETVKCSSEENTSTTTLDQYVDTLVRKAEASHNNKEDQILQKQQILEELQRVERELQGKVIQSCNYPRYPSPFNHTVETQTGLLHQSSSPWQVLKPPCDQQQQLPLTNAVQPTERTQVFTGDNMVASYLSPSSPPCVPPHYPLASTGPATTNVPVSERRKMVPSKKKDKKHMVLAGQLPPSSVLGENGYPILPPPPPGVIHPNSQIKPPPLPPPILSLLDDQERLKTKGAEGGRGKKDKKRSVPSDCDCIGPESDIKEKDHIQSDLITDFSNLQMPSQGLGAVSGQGLQMVPGPMVSSQQIQFSPFTPLPYGHIPAPNSLITSTHLLSMATAANVTTTFVTSPSCCAPGINTTHPSSLSKSQAKQFLLQPLYTSTGAVDATNRPGAANLGHLLRANTPTSTPVTNPNFSQQQQQQQVQQQQQQQLLAANKKSMKKALRTSVTKQPDLNQVNHQQTPGIATATVASSTTPEQQQVGCPLEVVGPQNMVYPTMIHIQAQTQSVPLNTTAYGHNHRMNDSGLMVATHATPAKILNDQMPDAITMPSAQVANGQTNNTMPISIPYPTDQVSYNTVNHYNPMPTPLVDVDSATDSNHDTALTLACAGGHDELVQLLLARGANIEHRDKKGFTPLILAATAGHAKVVETLLNSGSNIEAQSERTKDTPLSLACSGGRFEVVEILLARNAIKEHRNVSDYTPLSLAASGGYVNIIRLLLDHGAEINSRTGSKLGISPLMLAAMNGHTAAVKLLLDMGSDINAQIETNRNTALTLACFQGRHEVVALLLDRKANVEHRAKTGLTPLMEAASGGYVEVGRVLLDKGADVNASPVPSSRDTALTIAADKGHYKFVELLVQRGAQVEVKNKKGNSPLWLAANGGHLEVVQMLFNAGADIDSEDNRRVSCLMATFKRGHHKTVKYMVKHVTQFPSDQELTRFIATLSERDVAKKCNECLETIRAAKDKQAQEANKNASNLLEELEQEKTREESRKRAALRRRQKKKAKKQEKKEERRKIEQLKTEDNQEGDYDYDDDEEDDKEESNNRLPNTPPIEPLRNYKDDSPPPLEEESPAVKVPEHPIGIEERDGDSGIDSNSQTSATSETKPNEDKENTKGKRKKKKKEKENKKNTTPSPVPTVDEVRKAMTACNINKVAVPSATAISEISETTTTLVRPKVTKKTRQARTVAAADFASHVFFEPVNKNTAKKQQETSRVAALDTFGEELMGSIPGLVGSTQTTLSAPSLSPNNKSSQGQGTSPKKGGRREEGWKEVSRKGKRVSVPNSAISRVIGRGGCNINAIREVSGAHIEVEKQGKSQGDRMIIIKGSTEATRQAQNLIAALVKDPEKDLSELIPAKSAAKLIPKPSNKSPALQEVALYHLLSMNMNKRPAITAVPRTITAVSIPPVMTKSSSQPAWTTTTVIQSPKRTPTNIVQPPVTLSKSPAVRQLFSTEKKILPQPAKLNMASEVDAPQTFASKLVVSKVMRSITPPACMKPINSISDISAASSVSEPIAEVSTAQTFSIFNNNPFSKATQEAVWGCKDKPLTFAKAASEGLPSNPPKLATSIQVTLPPSIPVNYELLEAKPPVEPNRAPGYRGSTSAIPSVGNYSPPEASLPVNTLAKSAPGTPVASPSPLRPIGPPLDRQTATPPPNALKRPQDINNPVNYGYLPGTRTPPPAVIPSQIRMSLPSTALAPGAHLSSRPPMGSPNPQTNTAAAMAGPGALSTVAPLSVSGSLAVPGSLPASGTSAIVPPCPMSDGIPLPPPEAIIPPTYSVASLPAPGTIITPSYSGMGSTYQRSPERSEYLNLAPGRTPYRKPMEMNLGALQQLQQQQQQQQHQQAGPQFNLQFTGLINSPRFTTPQTNTHPVFTNNIMAPITATPQIQSNLNPNAPDFSSRATPVAANGNFVNPVGYTPRTQLTPGFQTGTTSVAASPAMCPGFGTLNQFQDMQPGFQEVMNFIPRSGPVLQMQPNATAYRLPPGHVAQPDGSPPLATNSPSNPASPQLGCEDRMHAKLQPIGTERAKKRELNVAQLQIADMLWSKQDLINQAQPGSIIDQQLPQMAYYADIDINQYNPI